MLIEVSKNQYRKHFPHDPHPYITEGFIGLVEHKTDKIVRLIDSDDKVSIGLIAGVKDNILCSPFSAPFGGFHSIHDDVFYSDIYNFLVQLKEYAVNQSLKMMTITLPPNIYNSSINAKFVNAFVRTGYTMEIPDIVNGVDLNLFNGTWERKKVVEAYKSAVRNDMTFSNLTDEKLMEEAYEIIVNNRIMQDRNIYLSFSDLMEVNKLFPVDFFSVKNSEGLSVGAGVFYRGYKKIVQGIFMGDLIPRKAAGVIDFLILNIYNHYKKLGFEYIDTGLSSKLGIPNEGLIRFKEIHNSISSLRYTFTWRPED